MDDKENVVDDLSLDELIKLVKMQAAMIKRLEKRLDDCKPPHYARSYTVLLRLRRKYTFDQLIFPNRFGLTRNPIHQSQ